jgi:hypothetical protein
MKKQTAVDWLEKFLKERYPLMDSEAIFQHAKEMEKEQLINGYADGINYDFTDLDIEFGIGNSDREYHAEKYYNQTYK